MSEERELDPMGSCFEANINNFDINFDDKFGVLNINLRSAVKNFSGLLAFLGRLKSKVSLIVITESWLNNNIVSTFTLQGYRSVYINI